MVGLLAQLVERGANNANVVSSILTQTKEVILNWVVVSCGWIKRIKFSLFQMWKSNFLRVFFKYISFYRSCFLLQACSILYFLFCMFSNNALRTTRTFATMQESYRITLLYQHQVVWFPQMEPWWNFYVWRKKIARLWTFVCQKQNSLIVLRFQTFWIG